METTGGGTTPESTEGQAVSPQAEAPATTEAPSAPGTEGAPAATKTPAREAARATVKGPSRAQRALGAFLVAVAASLWATDALFRYPTLQRIPPVTLVMLEHAIAVLALVPFVALFFRKTLFSLSWKQWIAALVTGAGGSALATVLFTASFGYVNPSVAILLQKLQPVLTVVLSLIFLGDRPSRYFFLWAPVALISALVVSFPDIDVRFLRNGLDFRATGVLFASSAAAVWALSTVMGKVLLNGLPVTVGTFWRFWFGLVTLVGLQLGSRDGVEWSVLRDPGTLRNLGYMSLVPGLAAVYIYYSGLKRTHASTATFVELIFPVAAVALNTVFLGLPLQPLQLAAGAFLLASVTMITTKGH